MVMEDQDRILIILVMRYITHKQDNKMHSNMAYVQTFLEFSTTYQDPKQSNTDYYTLLKPRRYRATEHGG